MTELLKFAAARALVDAGAVNQVRVVGVSGGWAVQLQTPKSIQMLSSERARAEVRRFSTFEAALNTLRELGLSLEALRVDAAKFHAGSLLAAKRRPRQAAIMKQKDTDARYTAMLRTSLEEARADTRPALSSAEAEQYMDAVKHRLRQSLDIELRARGA